MEVDAGRRRPPARSPPLRTTARCGASAVTPQPGRGVRARSCCRRKNLFCGDVDARTANGAVAVDREVRPLQLRRGPGPRRLAGAVVGRHGDAGRRTSSRARPTRSRASPPTAATPIWPEHDGYVVRTEAGIHAPPPGHARPWSTPAPPRSPTHGAGHLPVRSPGRAAGARSSCSRGTVTADPVRQEVSGDRRLRGHRTSPTSTQDTVVASATSPTPAFRHGRLPPRPVLAVGGHAGRPGGRRRRLASGPDDSASASSPAAAMRR